MMVAVVIVIIILRNNNFYYYHHPKVALHIPNLKLQVFTALAGEIYRELTYVCLTCHSTAVVQCMNLCGIEIMIPPEK